MIICISQGPEVRTGEEGCLAKFYKVRVMSLPLKNPEACRDFGTSGTTSHRITQSPSLAIPIPWPSDHSSGTSSMMVLTSDPGIFPA